MTIRRNLNPLASSPLLALITAFCGVLLIQEAQESAAHADPIKLKITLSTHLAETWYRDATAPNPLIDGDTRQTLQKAIRGALLNNPDIKATHFTQQNAKDLLDAAKLRMYPSGSISSGASESLGAVPVVDKSWISGAVTQTVIDFGARQDLINEDRDNLKNTEAGELVMANQIAYGVAQAYILNLDYLVELDYYNKIQQAYSTFLKYVQAQEKDAPLQLAKDTALQQNEGATLAPDEQDKLAKKIQADTQRIQGLNNIDALLGGKLDDLRAQIDSLDVAADQAQRAYKDATGGLIAPTELVDGSSIYEVEQILEIPPEITALQMLQPQDPTPPAILQFIQNSPSIQAMIATYKSAHDATLNAIHGNLPSFSIGASGSLAYGGSNSFFSPTGAQSAGISANLNIPLNSGAIPTIEADQATEKADRENVYSSIDKMTSTLQEEAFNIMKSNDQETIYKNSRASLMEQFNMDLIAMDKNAIAIAGASDIISLVSSALTKTVNQSAARVNKIILAAEIRSQLGTLISMKPTQKPDNWPPDGFK